MSTNHLSPVDQDAWYRQFYVWLIIFLPACAIAASFATLYIAAKDPPDLVVDDYSSIESIVARNVEQDKKATELGLHALLTFGSTDAAGTPIEVRLQATDPDLLPGSVKLRVMHSTRAAQDAEARLDGTAGQYRGTIKLPMGRYDIFLEDADGEWRLTTRVLGQPETLTLGAPDPTQDAGDKTAQLQRDGR